MNDKFFKIYRLIIFPVFFLIIGIFIYNYFSNNTKNHNITKEEKVQILNLINHDLPDFKMTANKNIAADKRLKDICFGKYDWHFYKSKGNTYYVLYGYFGYQKLNKIILNFFQNFFKRRINRPVNLSLSYFLTVDLDKRTVEGMKSIDLKPPIEVNSDL